jgi:UDP-N-acetylmuramoylalanine--D-glutamate ligase
MKVLVWGLGVSGLSAINYFSKQTDIELFITNAGDKEEWGQQFLSKNICPEENLINESDTFSRCRPELIILSPGVPRENKYVQAFIEKGVKVICDCEYLFQKVNIPIVAITGTNGKTTTTTMIKDALELSNKSVFMGGNIGIPAFDFFKDPDKDFIVLELSSFQLESIDKLSPRVSILLNVSENHMERYNAFSDYKNAKLNIFRNQSENDLKLVPRSFLGDVENSKEIQSLKGYNFSKSKLVGTHNFENFYCVEQTLSFLGIKNYKEVIQKLIDEFRSVPYRLEFLKTAGEINFYNDAKSTNSASTIAAIKSFEDDICLIMGGKVRDPNHTLKNDFKDLKIKKLIAIGEAKELIDRELSPYFEVVKANNLKEAFELNLFSGFSGNVLFSPAFPSFDQYKNYIERGQDFTDLVNRF